VSARWQIVPGDALEVLRAQPDASFDAMLTDPPAGIAFMSRDWDKDKGGRTAWVAWLAEIMREALRCLKPGAYALVWSLPRTQHWTMTALEDAGFEIRDTIDHIFGSGFPKSLDVSKAIDAAAGAERPVIGLHTNGVHNTERSIHKQDGFATSRATVFPATAPATAWSGYGTALKPAKEVWILCRKPLDGTVAHNVEAYGVGGINIDGCRIGWSGTEDAAAAAAATGFADSRAKGTANQSLSIGKESRDGTNTYDPFALKGRWPANLVLSHHERCVRVGTKRVRGSNHAGGGGGIWSDGDGVPVSPGHADADGYETHESWDCVDGCPIKLLDDQSGGRPGMSGGGQHRADYGGGMFGAIDSTSTARADIGGASRFFACFSWCAKPSTSEREFGCEHLPRRSAGETTGGREDGSDGLNSPRAGAGRGGGARNFHPTIKAIKLTKYFATLLLPPHREGFPRRILTPFCGSGSEMIGAMRAGWDECVGIDQDEDFVRIARARLTRWEQVSPSLDEADVVSSAQEPDELQPSLFGKDTGT
jgi:hypothetical protein